MNTTALASPSIPLRARKCPSPGYRSDHLIAERGEIEGPSPGVSKPRPNGVPHARQASTSIGFLRPHAAHGQPTGVGSVEVETVASCPLEGPGRAPVTGTRTLGRASPVARGARRSVKH